MTCDIVDDVRGPDACLPGLGLAAGKLAAPVPTPPPPAPTLPALPSLPLLPLLLCVHSLSLCLHLISSVNSPSITLPRRAVPTPTIAIAAASPKSAPSTSSEDSIGSCIWGRSGDEGRWLRECEESVERLLVVRSCTCACACGRGSGDDDDDDSGDGDGGA